MDEVIERANATQYGLAAGEDFIHNLLEVHLPRYLDLPTPATTNIDFLNCIKAKFW